MSQEDLIKIVIDKTDETVEVAFKRSEVLKRRRKPFNKIKELLNMFHVKHYNYEECYKRAVKQGYASNDCCLGEISDYCYSCEHYCDTFGDSDFSLMK